MTVLEISKCVNINRNYFNFQSSKEQVKKLAMIAKESGLNGVIASGRDIKMIRSIIGKDMKIFCPGIRLDNKKHDQKKVVTYSDFLKDSDENCFAVIGRPIYEGNAKENIKKILDSAK